MVKKEYNYPKNSTLNLIWEVFWPLGLYLLSSVVLGMLFGIIIVIVFKTNDVQKVLNDNIILLNILSQILALVILLPIFLKRRKYIPSKKIIIKKEPKKSIIYILTIISIGIISGFFFEIIEKYLSIPDGGLNSVNEMLNSGGIVLTILTVIILAPIVEELMLRGLIFNKLNSKVTTKKAVIISALLFGLIHLNLLQGLNAFIMGLALGYIYSKTYNLWICILAHLGNNLLSIISQKINYAINSNYTFDTPIVIIFQVIIIVITVIMIINNKKIFTVDKASE